MQPDPQTPTKAKANDDIERTKQSLSIRWGIRLPERDSLWSPSRSDQHKLEEKISNMIQFLYFKDGALDVAIKNFEGNAVNIQSEWVYKPRADADVIPNRGVSKHQKRETFLQKRGDLPAPAVKELTESLLHHLLLIVDRVKSGDRFSKPVLVDGKILRS